MDSRRLADVRAGTGTRATSCGSGYLIAPRLVLTARHVVTDDSGRPFPRIQVGIGHPRDGRLSWAEGQVCWPGPVSSPGQEPDAVLLRLDRPAKFGEPVRWGRLVTDDPAEYRGLGYPRFADYADSSRGVEQLRGSLPPLATGVGGGFVLDQQAAPDAGGVEEDRAWSGVSGAAVFCAGLLVAMVVRDDSKFGNRRLHAVPVSWLFPDPSFAELVGRESGTPPVLEPAELAGVLHTQKAAIRARTPGSLLAAAAETVTFQGREDVLRDLAWWRDGQLPFAVGLVIGEGGQGKTRLARKFTEGSDAAGWVCGWTEQARVPDEGRRRPLSDTGTQKSRALTLVNLLTSCTAPVLVVCDYAEAHPDFVNTLVAELVERQSRLNVPVRVLLLARTAGAWWEDVEKLLGEAATLTKLAPLGADDQTRNAAYRVALADLARGLERLPEPAVAGSAAPSWSALTERLVATPPPTDERSGNALTLFMIALLALLDAAAGVYGPMPPAHPEQRVVEHERDYLLRAAAAKRLLEPGIVARATDPSRQRQLAERGLLRALAGLILLGPCDNHLAARVAGLASEEHADDVVDWLRALYPPQPGDADGLGSVQPDRLAEYLLGGILLEEDGGRHPHEDLPERIGGLVADLPAAQAALLVMVRTATHADFRTVAGRAVAELVTKHPDPFAAAAPFVATTPAHRRLLLGALLQLALENSGEFMSQIGLANRVLPDSSVSLAYFTLAVTEFFVDLFTPLAGARPDLYGPPLAMSLGNYATRLADVGRPREALRISADAVDHYRALAGADREANLPGLATAVSNHAVRLAALGRDRDALPLSAEAVELRTALAEADPDAYLPDLATSLDNHALRLAALGRRQEALPLSERAVRLRRALTEANADAYLPDLAVVLSHHAVLLADLGRAREALSISTEALGHCRALAEVDVDAYRADLAGALSNHGVWLYEAGMREEGLRALREAVGHHRALAEADPDGRMPALLASLGNHATRLADAGARDEALPLSQEAVDGFRVLAEVNPGAHLADLATALSNHATLLSALGRGDEALLNSQEAVDHFGSLVDTGPHLPELARSLNSHASVLMGLDRPVEALPVLRDAIAHFRTLAAANPDAHLASLAICLRNQGRLLASLGRAADALPVLREVVEHYRILAETAVDSYRPLLAEALGGYAAALSDTGRSEEALPISEEAVTLFRSLAETDPDTHLSDAATVLANHARLLGDAGREADAVPVLHDVVRYCRTLAAADADAHRPDLAEALGNYAMVLAETGRSREALPVSQEAVDLFRALADTDAGTYLGLLAVSLYNHALRWEEAGQLQESREASREAAAHFRTSLERDPDTHRSSFARCLVNYATTLAATGEPREALRVSREAVDEFRSLAGANPGDHLGDFAAALHNHALRLAETGERHESLEASREAVEHLRTLYDTDPDAHRPALAKASGSYAATLAELGRAGEAVVISQEAAGHFRALAGTDPQAYLDNLAHSLLVCAYALLQDSRIEEAIRPLAEGTLLAVTAPRFVSASRMATAMRLLQDAYDQDHDTVARSWRSLTGQQIPKQIRKARRRRH